MKKMALALMVLLGGVASKSHSAVLTGGNIVDVQLSSNETFGVYVQYVPQANVGAVCPKSGWYYVYRSDLVSGSPMSSTAFTAMLNFVITSYVNKIPTNLYTTSNTCPLDQNPPQVAHFSSVAFR